MESELRLFIINRHPVEKGKQRLCFSIDDLADIFRYFGYACRLLGIFGIAAQQMPVIFYGHATTARGYGDRFDAISCPCLRRRLAANIPPPCINVAPHVVQAILLRVEVIRHCPTTARPRGFDQGDAEPVQHACSRGIDIGRQSWLNATIQYKHSARVPRWRPERRSRLRHFWWRNLLAKLGGQQRKQWARKLPQL